MISSFTSKVKSFIFNDNAANEVVQVHRKRKRPFDESDDLNGDLEVDIISVKKPKLNRQESSPGFFGSFLNNNSIQSMSDWVRKKTARLQWKTMSYPHEHDTGSESYRRPSLDKTGHMYGANGDSTKQATHHHFTKARGGLAAAYTNKGKLPPDPYRRTNGNTGSQQPLNRDPLHFTDSQSRTLQTDCSRDAIRPPQKTKQSRFDRIFSNKKKPSFTASESIRLDEKVRYQQLLQQFTGAPVEDVADTSSVTSMRVDPARARASVPQLARFYFNSNDSILGSNVSSDIIPKKPQFEERPRIKVVPSQKPQKPRVDRLVNGRVPDDSLAHVTDISAIEPMSTELAAVRHPRQTTIDLTDDTDDVQIIENRSIRVASPSRDYRGSKYLSDDWMKDLTKTYSHKERERNRKIAEEEMKTKLYEERRQADDHDLERKLRQRLQIHEREPAVFEEPPEVEVIIEDDEEDAEPELPELTTEMENQISGWLCPNPGQDVLVERFRLQITRQDIATLASLNWLNDEIINFYMNLLMERGETSGNSKVYAFNTFFYPKVMGGGQASVKRWTRRVDVLSMDYILIPVHLGMHWCLAVVDFKKKQIQYYDSMGGTNNGCLNAMKQYLCDESLDKKKQQFNVNGWTTVTVKDIPQQMNGSDCGMFACKYSEYITRGAPITFTQEHMPYFRRRMVYEIVTAKLLQ